MPVNLANEYSENPPFQGIGSVANAKKSDFRLFEKPSSRPYRRMGVAVTYDELQGDIKEVTKRVKELASKVTVLK